MPATSLAEIVARTLSVWGGLRTRPYSMGDPPPRNDCSSYVAEVLGLPSPLSWSTVNLPGVLDLIPWSQAEPGDVWGRLGPGTGGSAGHVAVITGTPRTRSDGRWEVVQQSGPTGVYGPTRDTYSAPPAGYSAYRSKYVTGGFTVDPDRFPFPGEYIGHIDGPEESHGGYYAHERPVMVAVQKRLVELGFSVGTTGADGVIGDDSVAAIKAWQTATGRTPTGQIHADDWRALFTPPAPPPPPPPPVDQPIPPEFAAVVRQIVREELAALRAELGRRWAA